MSNYEVFLSFDIHDSLFDIRFLSIVSVPTGRNVLSDITAIFFLPIAIWFQFLPAGMSFQTLKLPV